MTLMRSEIPGSRHNAPALKPAQRLATLAGAACAASWALAACAAQTPEAPAAAKAAASGSTDTVVLSSGVAPRLQCSSQAAQALVGQSYEGQATLVRALQLAGADEVRLLHVGQSVTKEFKRGRVNVVIDVAQRVAAVRCG